MSIFNIKMLTINILMLALNWFTVNSGTQSAFETRQN